MVRNNTCFSFFTMLSIGSLSAFLGCFLFRAIQRPPAIGHGPMWEHWPRTINSSQIRVSSNLTLGYNKRMTDVSKAASLMGRRSAQARVSKWGRAEFDRRMREWGKLGGRPRGSGKKKSKRGKR